MFVLACLGQDVFFCRLTLRLEIMDIRHISCDILCDLRLLFHGRAYIMSNSSTAAMTCR